MGYSFQRCRRAAETTQELYVRHRPNVGGADQSQLVNALGGRQAHSLFWPMRGSVPAAKRLILSECFHSTDIASAVSITAIATLSNKIAATGAETAATSPPTEEIRVKAMPPSQHTT
jgi:hypothetical protein